MTDCFEPMLFIRHNRSLQTLLLESQAWFCVKDLGRLMGQPLNERMTQKLDPDQRRTVWLRNAGQLRETAMISESGVFAMLVFHYVPENRSLRQWLSNEVLPLLRQAQQSSVANIPNLGAIGWPELSLTMLYWQNEPWIKLRDVPEVLAAPRRPDAGDTSRWRKVMRVFRGR